MICDMIIKAIRFRTRSSVSRLISHLQNGTDNDAVSFLSGTPADIADMHADARGRSSKYSIRHWIVAPHEAITSAQMREVVIMIAKEFDFDIERAVIVEHKKSRATADAHDTHWHVLVGEVNPASGKVLGCSFDRIIHELIARWSEYKFGQRFIQGKHTRSVIAGLRKRDAIYAASAVEAELGNEECAPGEAFTHDQHQATKRAGTDLPTVRQAVKHAMETATTRAELEITLAASSLLVMPGHKPGTWIVADDGGEFIGSLARLAGRKKSEITKVMGAVADEPASRKTDNPPSNFDRSASHPQPAGATKRPASAGSRRPHSNTGQNSGRAGKRIEPDRTPESEIGLPQALAQNTISWFTGLHKYTDQLSLLLAKANMLAMSAEERIAACLWEIEEQARFDSNRNVPVFAYSEKTARVRAEVADREKSLAKKWETLFDAERRFEKVRRPKWWHYLLGIAFVFERQQRHLALAAKQASDDLESCQRGLESAKTKLRHQEFQDKQRHTALVEDIATRKHAAGPILDQVNAANQIIRTQPAMVFCGLGFVLACARGRIDEEKRKGAKMAKNLDSDGFGYKR